MSDTKKTLKQAIALDVEAEHEADLMVNKHEIIRTDKAQVKLTDEQKDLAILYAAQGDTIAKCAEKLGIDSYAFYRARQQDLNFANKYNAARSEGMNALVDRLDNIHEEYDDVQRARLASENIKWKASKLNSKVYGDKLDLNVTNKVDVKGALDEAKARISSIMNPSIIDVEAVQKTPDDENDSDAVSSDND